MCFRFFLSSLSPLRRQVILETSGSLSPSMPLPQLLCENPDYLPPALPPKRQRVNSKTINSLNTPPSSPKMLLNESIDENAETSSPNQNNNNVHSRSSHQSDTLSSSSKPLTPVTPSTPSFVAAPSIISSKSANVPLVSHTFTTDESIIKSPNVIKGQTQTSERNNHVADADVRPPIYSNDNRNTNSRFSDENQYIQLYDGDSGSNDKHKPKNGIDIGGGDKVKMDSDGAGGNSNTSSITINSNSKIKNNNNNSNTSDNNEHDDESNVVVLRHPSASIHSQKVCLHFFGITFNFLANICDASDLFRCWWLHVSINN